MHGSAAFNSDWISIILLDVLFVVQPFRPLKEGRSVADAFGVPLVYGTIVSCDLWFPALAVAISMLWFHLCFYSG